MTHKNFFSYQFAFSALNSLCKELGLSIKPEFVMCDFELALRNAIQECFPSSKIAGCYFHYSKALWHYMASHGFTTKDKLNVTIKLVTIFKILGHIAIPSRSQ